MLFTNCEIENMTLVKIITMTQDQVEESDLQAGDEIEVNTKRSTAVAYGRSSDRFPDGWEIDFNYNQLQFIEDKDGDGEDLNSRDWNKGLRPNKNNHTFSLR